MISEKTAGYFPWGTFIINISGALLLGLVCSRSPGRNYYLLLADGFLGAYTTFSTFMYEGFHLFQDHETANALLYIGGSFLLGIAGFLGGSAIGRLI